MFPNESIVLHNYSDQWPTLALKEIDLIRAEIPDLSTSRIEHIGSTSVPGLSAKPIIDIVIEVSKIEEGEVAINPLELMGYSFWRENPNKRHLFFVKGLPPAGSGRTHHVHIFESERFNEYLRFRDTLRANSDLAQEYQKLKLVLAERYRQDREAYTKAKSSFIQRVLSEAKK